MQEGGEMPSAPLVFEVAGSSGVVYAVTARRVGADVVVTCTCEAGLNRMACRHRLALIVGDVSAVISPNASEAAALRDWLPGSRLEAQLATVAAEEAAVAAARKRYSMAKKALGRILEGD